MYQLDIPNFEVKEAFNLHIMSVLTENDDVRTGQMRMEVEMRVQEFVTTCDKS